MAVVNSGSGTVTIFRRGDNDLALDQELTTASDPVSVAFGKDHLYILGTTTIAWHRLDAASVDPRSRWHERAAARRRLRRAGRGCWRQLLVTEKSGAVETIGLSGGVVTGPAVAVDPCPAATRRSASSRAGQMGTSPSPIGSIAL